ncbi:MAG: hypothetical protein ISS01_00160 [Nanoarchaeota archaeon]|nr:hypothetical protein [Nanoarchaeota archaeon]
MNIHIQENGCKDPEVLVLDTRLPYFYSNIKKVFLKEPSEIKVFIVNCKDKFKEHGGNGEAVYTNKNNIYICDPSLLESSHMISRSNFYKILCQEILFLFYQTNNKTITS